MKTIIEAEMREYLDGAYADSGTARNQLERFAELVRAAEREACALVCDEQADSTYWEGAYACARLIRARSNT